MMAGAISSFGGMLSNPLVQPTRRERRAAEQAR